MPLLGPWIREIYVTGRNRRLRYMLLEKIGSFTPEKPDIACT
jgi:hypothetical protein